MSIHGKHKNESNTDAYRVYPASHSHWQRSVTWQSVYVTGQLPSSPASYMYLAMSFPATLISEPIQPNDQLVGLGNVLAPCLQLLDVPVGKDKLILQERCIVAGGPD